MRQRATAISHQILWSDGLKSGESYVTMIGWCAGCVSEGGGQGWAGRCTIGRVLWIRSLRSISVPDNRRTSVDQIALKMRISHELAVN